MLYFAYGSNLNKVHMKAMCKDSREVVRVILKDYKLIFNEYANVIKSKGSFVEGALYDVSDDDLVKLDYYEEYPKLYKKENVKVKDYDKKEYEAFVYVMVNEGFNKPDEQYYNVIVQGYKDWNLNLSLLELARSI